MNKLVSLTLALALFTVTACAPTPSTVPSTRPPSHQPPTPIPTKIAVAAPTDTPIPTARPSAAPNVTIAPTATNLPTVAPSPSPTIPPGLYVTDLRTEPSPPARGAELIFYPKFLNTTGSVQTYKWIVYIYRPDTPTRSYGETTATTSPLPVGASESRSLGYWRHPLGGPCETFIARVAFFDQENKAHAFAKPDGQVFQKDLIVCPPDQITPAPPPPTPLPSPTPTYGPGMFVTDIHTDPHPPIRGTDLVFYVTFVNTTGNIQTYKWVVYIYKPDNPKNSYGETTGATTLFQSTVGEAQSAGRWKLPLGGPCEDFIVRAAWFDQENKAVFFTDFDYKPFEKRLTICPP